jgi:hypothetical protein
MRQSTRAILAQFDTPSWRQAMFKLTRTVTIETRRRCMCIPTREDAKQEAARIRRLHGAAVVKVDISKNGKGPTATYTCAYTLRETKTEELF